MNQSGAARRIAVRFAVAGHTADAPAQSIAPGKSADFAAEITVPGAKVWNLDSPAMYDAKVEVREGSATLDTDTVAFGFRDARSTPIPASGSTDATSRSKASACITTAARSGPPCRSASGGAAWSRCENSG